MVAIEENNQITQEPTMSKPKFKPNKKLLLAIFVPIFVILFLLGGLGLYSYSTYKSFLPLVNKIVDDGTELSTSFQSQDLATAKVKAVDVKSDIAQINDKYSKYMWASKLPFVGNYVQDVQSALNASGYLSGSVITLIDSVEPYADLLGFKTSVASDSATQNENIPTQSIEDRIVFMAETLDKISPDLDLVAVDMTKAQSELDKIDPNRYPELIKGKNVRQKIVDFKSVISESSTLLTQVKPLIKLLPSLLGNPDAKRYMLLFQNDAEIRPTGGFLTAYAFLKVTKGKVEPQASYDIYDLDARFNKKVPSPDPIKKYLNESYLNIRNSNFNPDFKLSMDDFVKYYGDTGGTQPDGIIAMDTQVPVEILKVIGPIGVGGWGNFSAENDPRCDCPQVVYELEEIADRPTNTIVAGRKAVLGPLMHSMLANAMGSPKHLWPKLINVVLNSINEKHLLFYFFDEETQKVAEEFNAAGRLKDYAYDYLHINDANLGGAKTDMFITRDVEQEIEKGVDGVVTKTLTINYHNPYKGSNCNLEAGQLCLNGTYRDYVRVMVPLGSKLISVVGSEVKENTLEEDGKTVFDAFFTMRPESQSKLVFKYTLPANLDLSVYKLLIQKQPGLPTIKYTTLFNGIETVTELKGDQEVILN